MSSMHDSIVRTLSCVLAMSDVLDDFIHEFGPMSVRAGYDVCDGRGHITVFYCCFSNFVLWLNVVEFDSLMRLDVFHCFIHFVEKVSYGCNRSITLQSCDAWISWICAFKEELCFILGYEVMRINPLVIVTW